MNKYILYMRRLYFFYEIFKSGNFVARFHEKCNKKLVYKWIYIFYPFVVFSINMFAIISNNALYSTSNDFTYLNDLSNSLGLSTLFFVSYFLSGYFPYKFEEWLQEGLNNSYDNYFKSSKKCNKIFNILPFVSVLLGCVIGYCFYNITSGNDNAFWIKSLDYRGRIVYCVFLGITWGRSISLLGMSLMSGFFIYLSIKTDKIKFILHDFNLNISIIKIFDVLVCTLSYGLFYVMGAVLFILNDKVAAKLYGVYNAFSNDRTALLLIMFVLFMVSLAYIPLQELYTYMRKKKKELINQLELEIDIEKDVKIKENIVKKKNEIIVDGLIYTSFYNKLIIFLSVFIPLIGVVLQAIELLY